MPTGVQAGDVVLILINAGNDAGLPSAAPVITPPGTVTLVASTQWGDTGIWLVNMRAYRYVVTGSGDPSAFVFTNPSGSTDGIAIAWSGVDTSTPIDVTATANAGNRPGTSGSSATALGVTTTVAGVQLVAYRNSWDGNQITPPSGWTERLDQPISWIGERSQASAGASGDFTIPAGNNADGWPWGAILIPLRPAGGGADMSVSGTVAASSTATAAVLARHPVTGAVAATTAAAAAVQARSPVTGSAAATTATAAAVDARRPVAGSVSAVSTVQAAVGARLPVAGTTAAVSATSLDVGVLPGAGFAVSGSVQASSAVSGTVSARLAVNGSTAATSAAAADVSVKAADALAVAGTVHATSTATAQVGVKAGVAGQVAATTAVSATAGARLAVAGTAAAVSTVRGLVGSTADVIRDIDPVLVGITGHPARVDGVTGHPAELVSVSGHPGRIIRMEI